MIKEKELIELLKSGDFTIASHDYGQVSIYNGKFKGYNSKEEMEEWPKEVAEFNLGNSYGYMQDVVALLTKALGGQNGGTA